MLLTEIQQQSMLKRIKEVVSILMEEEPLFKEELKYPEIVQHLTKIFAENFAFEEFNTISEQSLKKRCDGIMSTELMAGMLDDLTPEEIAIFNEAIKRK